MVWDTGTWEPLGDAREMMNKGDLKFRLHGEKLNGEFVLAKMRSRRPGSKGTEWLLIKKKDEAMQPGFDIDKLDYSVLTQRSLKEIAGDEGSAEWESNRRARVKRGSEWLVARTSKPQHRGTETRRKSEDRKTRLTTKDTKEHKVQSDQRKVQEQNKSSLKKKSRRVA
jgi:bifunctional non-homologous end joining protein LigD